jgi:nucleoside-diphosphate-sugar epimerase
MTALAQAKNFEQFDAEFAQTNRLRTEGTDALLAAARAAGVRRFIAQSYTGWPNAREGGRVKTEDDPLDPDPPKAMRQTLAGIRHLEAAVTGQTDLTGIALRYGSFYGPGTSLSADGDIVTLVRRRKFPIVGSGAGVWSFIHIDDAAEATRLAVTHGPSGTYNIVDAEPAEVAEWLPVLAQAVGAKPPHQVTLSMMTRIRGASNARAVRALQWRPAYASWREGFVRGLA